MANITVMGLVCAIMAFLGAGSGVESRSGSFSELPEAPLFQGQGEDAEEAAPEEGRACEGTALSKGWCPMFTCGSLNCSANWKSVDYDWCADRCVPDSWLCCGWWVDTSANCACVIDKHAEPTNYNCAPCGHKYCNPWPSACQ